MALFNQIKLINPTDIYKLREIFRKNGYVLIEVGHDPTPYRYSTDAPKHEVGQLASQHGIPIIFQGKWSQ